MTNKTNHSISIHPPDQVVVATTAKNHSTAHVAHQKIFKNISKTHESTGNLIGTCKKREHENQFNTIVLM